MTAPKRSPLAAKVLEIEDSLEPPLRQNMAGEVLIPAKDWNALVRCASASELVDAEEAASRRALVEATTALLTACSRFEAPHDGNCTALECANECPVLHVYEALAGVKHG